MEEERTKRKRWIRVAKVIPREDQDYAFRFEPTVNVRDGEKLRILKGFVYLYTNRRDVKPLKKAY